MTHIQADDPTQMSAQSVSPEETDRELLQGCRAGDAGAWQRLVEKYERLIFSIPLRLGLTHEDATDIFQEAFAALFQSLDAIQDDMRVGGWLATVARRHAWVKLNRARAEGTIMQSTEESEEALVQSATALGRAHTDRLQQWEMTMWLDQALSTLGKRCRELLRALYLDVQESSYAQISHRLHVPAGSIGPTRARCLEQLRQALQTD